MKRNFTRAASLVLIFVTLFGLIGGNTVLANSNDTQEIVNTSEVTYQFLSKGATPDDITPLVGVGTVVIFVGGIVAAWLVDGVLIYATGYTGSEWVAKGLEYFRSHPYCEQVQVTNAGRTYCGAGRPF